MKSERVVAVPELAEEQREARGDHQRPDAVPGAARPRDEAGEEERPPDGDDRERARRRREAAEVVDLHLVGEDAEDDACGRERDLDSARPRHMRIVTRSRRRVHGAAPEIGVRENPETGPETCVRRRFAVS